MDVLRAAVRKLSGPMAADLLESEEAYLLVIDVPGATAAHTSISTANGRLRVVADRDGALPAGATMIREERPRTLELEIPLPSDAEGEEAHASLSEGILEITIPRGEPGVEIPITDE